MSATGSGADRGFTLIEMLAVLAITAMVSALAFPRLERAASAMGAYQARQTVVSQLQTARGAALAGGAPVSLSVAEDGSTYASSGAAAIALPQGVRLRAGGGRPVTFFADGSASQSSLTLQGGGPAARITVSAAGAIAVAGSS